MPLLSFTLALLLCSALHADETSRTYGRFLLKTDTDNLWLPSSLQLKDVPGIELLNPKIGLNLSFTDFEFRNKFYREENKYIWEKQTDPRFVVDVKPGATPPSEEKSDGFIGESVSYESSFAKVKRSILFHPSELKMRIAYRVEATRELLIHMPDMFAVALQMGNSFTVKEILDERNPTSEPLATSGKALNDTRTLFNMGPTAFTDKDSGLSILVSHAVSGDIPALVPSRMIRLAAGKILVIAVDLDCFVKNREGLLSDMRSKRDTMDPDSAAYRLFATGYHVLYNQKKEHEGEALLNKVAAMKPEWYMPHMMIAEYRLQNNIDGLVLDSTRGQNYHESAFRMPWNYGIILRGTDYLTDKRLTEEQQRLLLFNLLCAMENTLFYPEYYVHVAKPFEERKMFAQACAIYRQALWAVARYPVTEQKREKFREQFKKKIAQLEEILVSEITANPPQPIPVRPDK